MPGDWVEKIFRCAIVEEERAADFYRYLAREARHADMREVFLDFAREEDAHKAKLLSIQAGQSHLLREDKVVGLGLADQFEDEPIDLGADIDYAQALVIAIKSEQKAYDLYSRLADSTDDAACKSALRGLAREEARHKAQFEREYQEHLRGQNGR